MPNPVTATPPAPPEAALAHFALKLALETDCADVHDALAAGATDFVLVEARGPAAYARGHIPGALNLPHREITAARLAEFPPGMLFVAYCAGPHCNAADQAALKLARLGIPVKTMPGGIAGWLAEGYGLAEGPAPGRLSG